MTIEQLLKEQCASIFQTELRVELPIDVVTVSLTKKEFEGDYTIVVFPLIKYSKMNPEETGKFVGEKLKAQIAFVEDYNVLKGFLNLTLNAEYWFNKLSAIDGDLTYGTFPANGKKVLLEYCGPNTNKPLHIGHLRNILIGYSTANILTANGYEVIKANIYNDRGIAICKSMVAYLQTANGETPESAGIKGDHLVGDYYVRFNELSKEELATIPNLPADKDEAAKHAPIFKAAQEMLLKWEAGDAETIALWNKMNGWVYDGYEVTYKLLGVDFQVNDYESETYKLGKEIIEEGLAKGVFYKRADGAVAIDLTADGLDEKVLLRSDGTSIYITQDIGTADSRYKKFQMDKMIYCVMNEQDYHFKVLKVVLQKLGKQWADGIYHLSYAMVSSPTGRFKSREGNTADADDLIAEVLRIAEQKTKELGKIEGFTEEEANTLYRTIGLGALKFFILRVNPYKKIVFNPEESIDFHGHTGPFIQYTHARIKSIVRRAEALAIPKFENYKGLALHPTERELIVQLNEYPNIVKMAAEKYDPSELSNYVYSLCKLYNKFYAEQPILAAAQEEEKAFRVSLSRNVASVIKKAMLLLGIEVPEKM